MAQKLPSPRLPLTATTPVRLPDPPAPLTFTGMVEPQHKPFPELTVIPVRPAVRATGRENGAVAAEGVEVSAGQAGHACKGP